MKKETIKTIVQVIVAALTALLTSLGVVSCMLKNLPNSL